MADIFRQGQKTTIIAALTTVGFALARAIVGIISGSVVLLGDAVHSFADSFSSFAAWFGLKIAKKEPTQKFPYGFYKAESIAAFLISLLILFAGYSVLKESVNKFSLEHQLSIPLIAVSVAILDAVVMFLIGSYEMKVGKKINSQSLVADGKESKMHILSSSVVVVGLISVFLQVPYLEGTTGILISLFIFQAGIKSARDSIFSLMDVSPDPAVEKKIRNILNQISGLRGFKNLKLRKSGPFIFGEVEAKIGKTLSVKKADEISGNIEKEIKRKVKTVDSFVVSFKPFETKKQKICIPVKDDKDLESEISSYFGRAPLFMFLEVEEGIVKSFYTKENPYRKEEVRAGFKACDFVIKQKIDSIITKEMGPISFHTLRDNIVDIYKGVDGTAKEVIRNHSQEKLDFLEEPTRAKT